MKKLVIMFLIFSVVFCLCACEKAPTETTHSHTYAQGVCTDCGETQPNYCELVGNEWMLMGLTESGDELDVVTFWLDGEHPSLSASFYGNLSTMSPDEQDSYLGNGAEVITYEGQQFCHLGFGKAGTVTYTVDGDTAVLEVDRGNIGTLTLQRIAGDQFRVIAHTGTVIDTTIHNIIVNAGVFTCVQPENEDPTEEPTQEPTEAPTEAPTLPDVETLVQILGDGKWKLDALSQYGDLCRFTVHFSEERRGISMSIGAELSTLEPELQEDLLNHPEDLVEFEGKKYYIARGDGCDFTIAVVDNQIVITLDDASASSSGSMITVRQTGEKQLTVVSVTGTVLDTNAITEGAVFTWSE